MTIECVVEDDEFRASLEDSLFEHVGAERVAQRLLDHAEGREELVNEVVARCSAESCLDQMINNCACHGDIAKVIVDYSGLDQVLKRVMGDAAAREELVGQLVQLQSPESQARVVSEVLKHAEARWDLVNLVLEHLGVEYLTNDVLGHEASRDQLLDELVDDSHRASTVKTILRNEGARERIVSALMTADSDGAITRAILANPLARGELLDLLHADLDETASCCSVAALKERFNLTDAVKEIKQEIAGKSSPNTMRGQQTLTKVNSSILNYPRSPTSTNDVLHDHRSRLQSHLGPGD